MIVAWHSGTFLDASHPVWVVTIARKNESRFRKGAYERVRFESEMFIRLVH
jgi:hypothetical protein